MNIHYAVAHKDKGSAYGISFPGIPGCFGAADKPWQLISKANEALALWSEGDEVPAPMPIDDVLEEARDDLAMGAFIVAVPFQPRPRSTEEMEPITIKQDRGPTLKFSGRLIAKTEFDMRSGGAMRYEIWETAGGALIAVSKTNRETRAVVVEPGDEFEMRCAVMSFLDWENRARSMVRDQLKWKLVREVA